MGRCLLLVCMALVMCLKAEADGFATVGLQRLAKYVGLTRLDTLKAGVHEGYLYKGRPLTVRVNPWNEVEHIGLKLFSQDIRKMRPLPVYDFLERYLLASNAVPEDSEERIYMAWDKVHYLMGDASAAMKIDSTASFSESHIDRHVYKVSWNIKGQKCLEMSFYMDYQLMTGCNAIELEQILFRKLRRGVWNAVTPMHDGFPKEGREYTRQGKHFISPMVRSDVYYTRADEKQEWTLVQDTARMVKTISNVMISNESVHPLEMMIKLDRYGLRSDSAMIEYRVWRQMCQQEGCTPYFGIKTKEGNLYRTSVFMVNESGGYLHLLSIDVPQDAILAPEKHRARARVYCYIPLHNVSDNVFNVNEYKKVK